MNSRRILFLIASIIVSLITLMLVLQNVPIEDVIESIQQADTFYLIMGFVFVVLSMFTRGIRWWGLLDFRLPIVQASHIVNVAYLGNQLPFRMGEVARSILATRGNVPFITSATSIVVERVVDMLFVVLMIAATVSQLPDVPEQVTQTASLFGFLAVLGFSILLILARSPHVAHQILDRLLKYLPFLKRLPLQTILEHVLDGLQPLTRIKTLLFTLIWSIIAWSMSLGASYFLHLALNIEINYLISVPLGIALASLSVALPVSVAALGPFEASIVLTGQLLNMGELEAISLGFLLHGVSVLTYAFWGVIGLLALGISPGTAFRVKDDATENQDESSVKYS